jgi:hypothetical protein
MRAVLVAEIERRRAAINADPLLREVILHIRIGREGPRARPAKLVRRTRAASAGGIA